MSIDITIKILPGLAEWLLRQPDPEGEALIAIINHKHRGPPMRSDNDDTCPHCGESINPNF